MASNPSKAVHAVADRLSPKVRKAFLAATTQIGRNLADRLARMVIEGDFTGIQKAIVAANLSPEMSHVTNILARGFLESHIIAQSQLVDLKPSFTMVNPMAAHQAKVHAARMVTGVSKQTKKAIATLTARAVTEGIEPMNLAKMIRPLIGLNQRQAHALWNARQAWTKGGLTGEALDTRVAAYSTRLLKQRATAIARTETIRAAALGVRQGWQDAVDRKILNPHTTKREWIAALSDRTCMICLDANGQVVTFEKPFLVGGQETDGPPAHPLCRCAVGLTFVKPGKNAVETFKQTKKVPMPSELKVASNMRLVR